MTFDLAQAVRTGSAIRFDLDLQPPGGPLQKVFPPTYPSPIGKDKKASYAIERRIIGGDDVTAALLDSVPSQANRLELALLHAYRTAPRTVPEPDIQPQLFPLVTIAIDGYGELTDLEVPHRIFDAILIDSSLDTVPFLQSPVGVQLSASHPNDATALYLHAPISLLFGVWNSHAGQRIGMARFARALTSEIIGWPVVPGVKTASRLDPLGIVKEAGTGLYQMYAGKDGGWTFDRDQAQKDKGEKPIKIKAPSVVGHGNIAPSLNQETGGVSIRHAHQNAVLSLVHLRNLHFPTLEKAIRPERDHAARMVLAALALVALVEQWENGYQLRSGCLLQPLDEPRWTLCGRMATEDSSFTLHAPEARTLLHDAIKGATKEGLVWEPTPIRLVAAPQLQKLFNQSVGLQMATDDEEE